MARGIFSEIEQLSQYKGIDPDIVRDAVKDAMLAAARKHYKTEEDLVAEINTKTGGLDVYAVKNRDSFGREPVEGSEPRPGAQA